MNKCPKCGYSGSDFKRPHYILSDNNIEWIFIKCRECGYEIDKIRTLDYDENYGGE